MHAGDGAREAVEGLRSADAGDVDEHPVEDTDLCQRGDKRGDHLHGEEQARRDLHIVAEFKVGGEFEALR